ncbi:MAG TPA: hypothetical protein VFA45_22915 [Actinomycetes bacterium]|jgi:hypothetical protein|nr:hypothetical protein [Actinomycetes bacterium]
MSAQPHQVKVELRATLELVGLVQQQLARLITEHEPGANTQPNVTYQLARALESLLQGLDPSGVRRLPRWPELNAEAVASVRRAVQVGRRLDMTEAFDRLNPTFGVRADHGCWDATAGQRQQRAVVRRRELELAMGERFARMLAPLHGGEAA